MNVFILSGYLARDPEPGEIKTEKGDLTTTRFSLPINKRKKNGEQETEWMTVKAFGSTAMYVNKYITKGCNVIVSGSLEPNGYEKDGIKHHGFVLNVQSIECSKYANEAKNDFVQKESDDISKITKEEVPF